MARQMADESVATRRRTAAASEGPTPESPHSALSTQHSALRGALSTQHSALSARQHVLDLDDFSAEEIEYVLHTADAMKEVLGRKIKQVPALRGVTVVTLFYEASTRTRVSFELAAKHLAADVVNVAASASSVTKGESLLDTAHTLRALGADILVMRH